MAKANAGGVCENCGLPLNPNAKFCGGCGTQVSPPASEAPAVGQPASRSSLDRPSGGSTPATREIAPPPPPLQSPDRHRTTAPMAVPGPPPPPSPPFQGAPRSSSGGRGSDRPGLRWAIIVAVVALLVVGGVAAALAFLRPAPAKTVIIYPQRSTTTTRPRPTPTTTVPSSSTSTLATTARQEAESLNALLINSSSDRAGIVSATSDISNCGNLSQDEATLQSSGQSRQMLLQQLSQLNTAELPNSAKLVSALTAAWQASLQADSSYAAWASDLEQSGCVGQASTDDANWQAAQTANMQATAAKTEFVAIWNPIASTYGLPQYTQQQI